MSKALLGMAIGGALLMSTTAASASTYSNMYTNMSVPSASTTVSSPMAKLAAATSPSMPSGMAMAQNHHHEYWWLGGLTIAAFIAAIIAASHNHHPTSP
jgi:hypothetical protein